MSPPDPTFSRAFVATSYLLGERGEALQRLAPEGAKDLADALGHGDRERRAATLAREIVRIALALDEGALS
jgi:hypothetical protein